jgi:hypothetical protein
MPPPRVCACLTSSIKAATTRAIRSERAFVCACAAFHSLDGAHRFRALPKQLSSGMAQRTGLARALVTRSKLSLIGRAVSALPRMRPRNKPRAGTTGEPPHAAKSDLRKRHCSLINQPFCRLYAPSRCDLAGRVARLADIKAPLAPIASPNPARGVVTFEDVGFRYPASPDRSAL